MSDIGLTRRRLVLLAATALGSSLVARRPLADPADQGIGGTGFSLRPADVESDRGIGGTGVIGTIRKFGSIVVNDMRIAYPADATVRIDGAPASASDLKLGHVVRVVATTDPSGGFSTRVIDVESEVVGPIKAVAPKTMTVLGQTVSTAELKGGQTWRPGEHVAVSGLRRPDGTIVASLIAPANAGRLKVAGPLVAAPDGAPRIGALGVTGVGGGLIGKRVVVEGHLEGARLAATRAESETALLPKGLTILSVEAYVERRGGGILLGSGLRVSNPSAFDVPAGRSLRAVLTTTLGADGRLKVDTLRSGGKRYRPTAARSTPRAPDGDRVPMNFDRRPDAPTRPEGGNGSAAPNEYHGLPGGPAGRYGPNGGFAPGGGGFGPPGGFGGAGRR